MNAAVATVASGARPLPPASAAAFRVITCHLSPYAPGCAGMPINDRRRWKEYWNRPVVAVMQSVLKRLNLRPGEVTTESQPNGDIAILGPAKPQTLVELDLVEEPPAPLAFLFDGVTKADIDVAIGELRRARWAPPSLGDLS